MSWGSSAWGGSPWGTGDDQVAVVPLNAFNADPGVDSGVLFKSTDVAPNIFDQNGFLFVLGHDQPGYSALVNPGDYVEVSQQFAVEADSNFLRVRARFRPPLQPLHVGYRWEASVVVDGAPVASRPFTPREREQDRDWWINLSPFVGTSHTVAVRLTLVVS